MTMQVILTFNAFERVEPKVNILDENIWPPLEDMVIAEHNVIHEPLVARDIIILASLHIKVSIIKQFLKALNKDDSYFADDLLRFAMEKPIG